jgi:hypothetical protein
VSNSALGYRTGSVTINNYSREDSSEYVFEIVPGFANESSSAQIKVTEFTTFKADYGFNVVSDRKTNVALYPSLPKKLEIYFDVPNEYFPENAELIGTITFESSATKEEIYELPLKFKF